MKPLGIWYAIWFVGFGIWLAVLLEKTLTTLQAILWGLTVSAFTAFIIKILIEGKL